MIERCQQPLGDYGGLNLSTRAYWRTTPHDVDELGLILRRGARDQLPLRLRGAGHSMNGTAVPLADELLISTEKLDRFIVETPSTITVEAGAAVWDVQRMLARQGASLRVFNDGHAAASTVGGYVSAGGFGADSWRHGGFWETVERIDVLTVDGETLRIASDDPLFPWLFGSMGQLAVITAATLKVDLLHLDAIPPATGTTGRIEASAHEWEKIVWLSVFAPRHAWHRAREELVAIGSRHAAAWVGRSPYVYALRFGRFNPPLIHPHQEDLVVVGIWGEAPFDTEELAAMEDEFERWLARSPLLRRYAQTERLSRSYDFERHFGSDCFSVFRRWKRQLDPAGRLGRGIFTDV